jgi:hypothetical protein
VKIKFFHAPWPHTIAQVAAAVGQLGQAPAMLGAAKLSTNKTGTPIHLRP